MRTQPSQPSQPTHFFNATSAATSVFSQPSLYPPITLYNPHPTLPTLSHTTHTQHRHITQGRTGWRSLIPRCPSASIGDAPNPIKTTGSGGHTRPYPMHPVRID